MKYKMIVFDLDGTLLNTLTDLKEACNYALKQYNFPMITLEQTRKYLGHGITHLISSACSNSDQSAEILKDFKKYYENHYNNFTKKYEGIQDVINYCLDNNIKIGVLTNKVEDIAINLIKDHFKDDFLFVYGDVENRKRKPNPDFLNELIDKHGLTHEEVLYVGDSEVDYLTSVNAKIDCLLVTYGFRTEEELKEFSCLKVANPKDIIGKL